MHARTYPGGEGEEGGVPGGAVEGVAREEGVEDDAERPDVGGVPVRGLLVEDLPVVVVVVGGGGVSRSVGGWGIIIHHIGSTMQSVECARRTGGGGEDLRADVAGLPAALLVADLRRAAVLGLRDAGRHACWGGVAFLYVYK